VAARLDAVAAQLDYETTRAYALALAADRRATLAEQATNAFAQARGVTERRLAAGDVSGYAHRRIRLEAARYAGVRAEAMLARRAARVALATLVSASADSIAASDFVLVDSLALPNELTMKSASVDSLIGLAFRSRADLKALDLDASTATAEARLTARERISQPALSVGFKNERIAGTSEQASGFAAGLSLPLPLWDRRAGAIAAADGESRRRLAEADALRRRIAREVIEARDGYTAVATQLELLAPELGGETRTAMRAVQVAYSEGEATVVEWLDAVRAYQEAESSFATLHAEIMIRRAALERAVGANLSSTTNRRGGDAPDKE
jgi:cobalt-zinc-cadmium efflux system outer membrane protein